jgi:hypothetical protein
MTLFFSVTGYNHKQGSPRLYISHKKKTKGLYKVNPIANHHHHIEL